MIRRRLIVEGRVQGVFYRASCSREAQQAGLGGHVRNLDDGSVEVVVEGEPDAVQRLVGWCRSGPPSAEVRAVRVSEETPVGAGRFDVIG